MPPALTPGSFMDSSPDGPDTPPDRPSLIVTLRVSSRLAARYTQLAMKRSREDSGTTEAEEPAKRTRLSALPAVEDEESADTEEAAGSRPTRGVNSGATRGRRPRQAPGSSAHVPVIEAIPNKPPSIGQPLVWAKMRGGLCEALPYFKAYKGSLHSAKVVAQGFLIDQEVDQLDVFGSQVIISSV